MHEWPEMADLRLLLRDDDNPGELGTRPSCRSPREQVSYGRPVLYFTLVSPFSPASRGSGLLHPPQMSVARDTSMYHDHHIALFRLVLHCSPSLDRLLSG
jgi:hypothetical protein